MALLIQSWNLNPNREWFARLADAGSSISVELYLTQADAQAQTNRQAHGATSGFGSALGVTLTNDTGAAAPISLFQSTYSWHLMVSGSDGDATKIFRMKAFVDLDEIEHPIYRNEALITSRATAEIDAHTHARIAKDIALGTHIPTLEPGDIVRVQSTRRGKNELLQMAEHRIMAEISGGGQVSLINSITAVGYLALRR
jgi:hypothetical protein